MTLDVIAVKQQALAAHLRTCSREYHRGPAVHQAHTDDIHTSTTDLSSPSPTSIPSNTYQEPSKTHEVRQRGLGASLNEEEEVGQQVAKSLHAWSLLSRPSLRLSKTGLSEMMRTLQDSGSKSLRDVRSNKRFGFTWDLDEVVDDGLDSKDFRCDAAIVAKSVSEKQLDGGRTYLPIEFKTASGKNELGQVGSY